MALCAVSSRNFRDGLAICLICRGRRQRLALVVENLLRELVGIVKDHRHVAVAANRERLPRVDVHNKVGRRVGRHRVGQAAHPSVLLAAVGRGGVPIRHRREVRERWILVSAAVHDGQLAVFVQTFETGHAAAESEMIVDGPHFFARNADVRAVMIIGVVAIRDQRIQPIVAARKFQHHQDLAARFGLTGKRRSRLREQRHGKRSRAHSDAVHAETQQIAPAGFGKREMILLHL